ncbi:molybdate ABC transporter substrate-binding protein [Sulfurimonas paralvinellae]|uniref:molybdate ABC transporter substrate-binding protein n=1 Tax=Sulfurimonas paralvinellae TaxID=317658 RepID=UPI001868DC84|nr:molybdate ABC transporter substrate-binding protein [Sulfurimonas paralvinellae]
MKKIFITLLLLSVTLFAQKITIFAASDLKFALDTIKADFLKAHKNDTINIIYGSSGKGRVQIERGAPYDIYFSANMDYVKYLYNKGFIITKPKLYAIGRLVIWSKNKNFQSAKSFENFTQPWVNKITIANPNHAPYGQKAKQALQSMHLYKKLKPKIVFGENISQTTNYINIKAADIGIIALSLALAPNIRQSPFHDYYLIDDSLHEPLYQGYGITSHAKSSSLAQEFISFFQQADSQKIMRAYGFKVAK